MCTTAATIKRGAFIVLEGCDRSGKSTQSRLLFEFLGSKNINAKHMVFPERSSNIGQIINAYLTNKQNLSDECIHLLFTANRWEYKEEMKKLLEAGTTLIVDRYSYSGVAYCVAKGLNYDWCMASEKGLLRPDAVFYLDAAPESLTERGNYGDERYEKKEFQKKVAEVFNLIYEQEQSYWHKVDAKLSIELLAKNLREKTLQLLENVADKPLLLLE